ncbi:anaphase-promoting complex subunit 3 isoform X1 [Brachionus plicatilis]|uniref:Anaphase-promoting complex subunit 3 isoform X1 n=1 Tax=Brachionus plicatilis TaxID=10195 RepID=A0A3M7RSF3_BRAPC|nr:anaphase-promoting complex subunit 3 isoform X1 [Brachionus plicatilis]
MRRTRLFFIVLAFLRAINTKNLFNEFLTDDNELSPIETKNADAGPKDTSKLIVNILYRDRPEKPKGAKNQIVYSTVMNSSGQCGKNVCKSNQVCVKRNGTQFQCANRPKKNSKQLASTKTTKLSTKKKVLLSPGCTPSGLTLLKIGLFELFDSLKDEEKRQIDRINSVEFSCPEPICRFFSQLDFNHNRALDRLEWSRISEYSSDVCIGDLGASCDHNSDNLVTFEEFCSCFQGIRSKCSYTRLHQDTKKVYVGQLNNFFKNLTLSLKSYTPICDAEGYFLPNQCDSRVTCWCVRKNGDPIEFTLSKINQTPKDCKLLIGKLKKKKKDDLQIPSTNYKIKKYKNLQRTTVSYKK